MFYQLLILVVTLGVLKADNSICGISPSLERYKIFNSNRIFGGENSNEGDFPWYIWMYADDSGCSGSIVHEKWILTAAHCVNGTEEDITIYYGSVDWKIMRTQKIKALNYFVHPEYIFPGYINDIALIELNGTLEYSEFIQPICLDSKVDPYPYEILIQCGMGSDFKKIGMMDLMQHISLNIFYKMLQLKRKNCEEERRICVGGINHVALPGDSGGPLMVIRENRWIQVGVFSTYQFNGFEGESLSIRTKNHYTRISYFCNWIKETTNDEVQC